MRQTSGSEVRTLAAPTFYLTGRQGVRPGAVVLGAVLAAGALSSVLWALGHNGHVALGKDGSGHSAGATPESHKADDDKDDDPNQVDTIVLGDPTDAPVPARKGDHVSPVHPTILVRLPRFGDEVGLIPNTPSGQLLYAWLAAFNKANAGGLAAALPSAEPRATVAGQLLLRKETGGFSLLSAKEAQPGVLVFRLRDQTPAAGEVLGTLQVRAGASPAAVASFSLRAVERGARVGAPGPGSGESTPR